MDKRRERFPFVAQDAVAGPANLAPMHPLRLRLGGREETVSGQIAANLTNDTENYDGTRKVDHG